MSQSDAKPTAQPQRKLPRGGIVQQAALVFAVVGGLFVVVPCLSIASNDKIGIEGAILLATLYGAIGAVAGACVGLCVGGIVTLFLSRDTTS